jgi:hypothetical protein
LLRFGSIRFDSIRLAWEMACFAPCLPEQAASAVGSATVAVALASVSLARLDWVPVGALLGGTPRRAGGTPALRAAWGSALLCGLCRHCLTQLSLAPGEAVR